MIGSSSLQVVSIGTAEDNYAFKIHEENLRIIFDQIAIDKEVVVISTVGAFRTGKSFMLSLMVQYLSWIGNNTNINTATSVESDTLQQDEQIKWITDSGDFIRIDAFDWGGGVDPVTKGIYMWSTPFIVNDKAILLVDTQGMFDHDTPMAVTTCIFAFTALISSYQIYNVLPRIQEDNLQHLAMFSSYAAKVSQVSNINGTDNNTSDASLFQHISFLVRDWPNFTARSTIIDKEHEMHEYITDKVFARGKSEEINSTRDAIRRCYQNITCFCLPNPGQQVVAKEYDGNIQDINKDFLSLVSRFFSTHVFGGEAKSKQICGRKVSAPELLSHIISYAKMFASGCQGLPPVQTILDATVNTQNAIAFDRAINAYIECMNQFVGPDGGYVTSNHLASVHVESAALSVEVLKVNTFSASDDAAIDKCLEGKWNKRIQELRGEYEQKNTERKKAADEIQAAREEAENIEASCKDLVNDAFINGALFAIGAVGAAYGIYRFSPYIRSALCQAVTYVKEHRTQAACVASYMAFLMVPPDKGGAPPAPAPLPWSSGAVFADCEIRSEDEENEVGMSMRSLHRN
jgi:atlastin